jgi:lysosomal acid lipase/cholesteryl ester hydrolase
MFRVPRKQSDSPSSFQKPVVLLMHGLLSSSFDWTILGPEKALAFMLSDAGYDVWLGNTRGNTYSRKHARLSTRSKEFWDFSWHEMGTLDLPAMIDFVLLKTKVSQIDYVGHSQGTTQFFVMAAMRPEYNAKVRQMHALSPQAFLSHMKSPLMKLAAPRMKEIAEFVDRFGLYEITPTSELFRNGDWGMSKMCRDEADVCANFMFLVGGVNTDQMNKSMIPTILLNVPAGSSFKQFVHFVQLYQSDRFQMFDFGDPVKNFEKYNNVAPPDYPLENISTPIYLHYGRNDWLAAEEDVNRLASKLKSCKQVIKVPHPRWSHMDFVYGRDADQFVYQPILDLLDAE